MNDEAIMILESTWHVIGTARADCPPYDGLVLQLSYRAVFIHRSLTPYETNSETIFVAYALNMYENSSLTSLLLTSYFSGRYNDKENSIAIPFLPRPTALDGSHAGDYGFDPLGLSEKLDFYAMQESEVRHARLAMLAAVGWPMSELLAPSWMLQNGCAPSVLNGVNPLSFLAIAGFLGAAGYFELKTSLRQSGSTPMGKLHAKDMSAVWKYGVAGDYNWDPLNLYSSCGDDFKGRKGLRDVELSHGRVAMLGITYFAFWEALTGHPIVENNMLFHPNALFPLLVAGYTAWSQIYEVGPLDEYPIEIKYANEGEMKLKRVQSGISDAMAQMNESSEQTKKTLDDLDSKFGIYEAPRKFSESVRSTYKYW